MQRRILLAALLTTFAASCNSSGSGGGGDNGGNNGSDPGGNSELSTDSLDGLILDEDGIVDLDDSVDSRFTDVFSKYTAIVLPTGRVHLLAEANVSDEKFLRVRNVLEHHVTRTELGRGIVVDKSDVAAAMVDSGALMGVFETADSASISNAGVEVIATALERSFATVSADTIVLEGTPEYLQASPALDTTFGATARLVYRTGLSVARPQFVQELSDLTAEAISAGEFTPSSETVAGDEPEAFLAMLLDVHSDIFGHDPDGDGAARIGDAVYAFGSRGDLTVGDPEASDLVGGFFAADHGFQVILPESFDGRFDGRRQPSIPYSIRSQYLRRIRLTGSNNSELRAASADCFLEGNDGNNKFKGRTGDDVIYGGAGTDQAIFQEVRANYDVRFEGDAVIVEDLVGNEGTDTIYGVERIYFPDETINL